MHCAWILPLNKLWNSSFWWQRFWTNSDPSLVGWSLQRWQLHLLRSTRTQHGPYSRWKSWQKFLLSTGGNHFATSQRIQYTLHLKNASRLRDVSVKRTGYPTLSWVEHCCVSSPFCSSKIPTILYINPCNCFSRRGSSLLKALRELDLF